PGQGEIRRTAEKLEKQGTQDASVAPLYGDLTGKEQDAAIRPAKNGTRKIVLATSIAETSITIDGVRLVIDGGLQRLPVFEAATGITRLETVRVSQASADQRAGRAGRTEPGKAIRLWRAEQTAALPAFTPPQILASDLSSLILDCAAWGVSDPTSLAFIDEPPLPALREARTLLEALGALDDAGRITATGKKMRRLGLPVRLSAMVIFASTEGLAYPAAELAVLMSEQGLGGQSTDLDARWRRFRGDRGKRANDARALAQRIVRQIGEDRTSFNDVPAAGTLLLPGFKDRVARRRADRLDETCRFALSNGRGAFVDSSDTLAREAYLVVTDLTGRAAAQRILSAAAIDPAALNLGIKDDIVEAMEIDFDRRSRSIKARHVRRLGSLVLDEQPVADPPPGALDTALLAGLETLGIDALPWSRSSRQLRNRLSWLFRQKGPPFPDVSDAALLAMADQWFLPFQTGVTRFDRIDPESLVQGLMHLVPHDLQRRLGSLAPTHFVTPAGSSLPIDYAGDEPVLPVRVQELFGLRQHPHLADGAVPLVLELLSPAQRPIQTTRDLPGFWAGSWAEVRADMRGRYPKHPWPVDPAAANPTTRVKHPRKH
ncbi:MAG: ATP-dependent helicase HrpB, partial [Pseudomonadota bacterium]